MNDLETVEYGIIRAVMDLGAKLREYHEKILALNTILERLTEEKEKCIKNATP